MATIEDVKSIIRGLLISTHKKMTVSDLCRDYVASEGKSIPFEELGFARLNDFLKTIPDVLQLKEGQFKGRHCLFVQPRINNNTQHMEMLVLEQNRKRHVSRRPRGISIRGSRCQSSPPRRIALASYNPSYRDHSRQTPDRPRQVSRVQSSPKTRDRSMCRDNQYGAPQTAERSPRPDVNSRLGWSPIRSSPRTRDHSMSRQDLEGAPQPGRSTRIIHSRLGTPTRSSPSTLDQSRMSHQDLNRAQVAEKSSTSRRTSRWDQRPVTQSSTNVQSMGTDRRLTNNKGPQIPEPSCIRSRCEQVPQESSRHTQDSSPRPASSQNVEGFIYLCRHGDSARTKAKKISIEEYRKLCNQNNAGPSVEPQGDEPAVAALTGCDVETVEPQRSEGEEAPFGHMPEISAIPQLSSDVAKVFVRPCTDLETTQRTTACASTAITSGGAVPARVLKLLLHVLDLYPSTGIPLTELLDKYKRYHKEKLDFSAYGYGTLMEMVASLKDHVFAVPPEAPRTLFSMDCARELKLCDMQVQSLPMNESSNVVMIEAKEQPSGSTTAARNLQPIRQAMQPKDVLVLGANLPPFQWPPEVEPECKMHIRITYVESPSKFYFTLSQHNRALRDMGLDMIEKYTHSRVSLRVRTLSTGLHVVTWKHSRVEGVPSIYHRAKILRVYDQNTCQILYIDVGEVCDKVRENLHYLLLEFAKFPAQAIQGSVYNLVPTSVDWTLDEKNHFSRMVRQGTVTAEVKQIDKANMRVVLDIVVRDNGLCYNVGQEMVRMKMAENQIPNFLSAASKRLFRERHPIFSAQQGWRPMDTDHPGPLDTAVPSGHEQLDQQAMDLGSGCSSPQCIDLSSDDEVEVLDHIRPNVNNRQRVYINTQQWDKFTIHVVNHKGDLYLLLEEVAKLLEFSNGFQLLDCTERRKCETLLESSHSNFFTELYSLSLHKYAKNHQIQLLPMESLFSVLRIFPKLKSLLPHVTSAVANFNPEGSCWYVQQ